MTIADLRAEISQRLGHFFQAKRKKKKKKKKKKNKKKKKKKKKKGMYSCTQS